MSIYNEDELQAPNWLTEEFLENVLRADEKLFNLLIVSYEITPASLKGDHFASIMFRAKIVYKASENSKETMTRSLVIKTLPDLGSFKADLLNDSKVFQTEISMYTKVLPEIQRILSKYGDNTIFGPRVVYSSLEPRKVIVFEDLCVEGFECIRGRGLQLDELKLVLLKLAKLHAVTYAIGQSEQASQVNIYQDGLFSNKDILEADIFKGGFKRYVRMLETDDELSKYIPQFINVEEHVWQGCIDLFNAYKNGENDIFVLNHGDFHLRNMMFKHNDKEKIQDIMMVDFQLSSYAPSAVDINYGIFTMFDAETRLKKRDEMIRFYFENFIATLKKIEFKGKFPEYAEFRISNLKYRSFAKFLLATFLPMINLMTTKIMDDVKDFDMSEAMQNADGLMFAYLDPNFIKDQKKLLPDLLNQGFLD